MVARNWEIDERLAKAQQLRRDKRWGEAESICREILEIEPNESEALHLLALLLSLQGRREEAIPVYRRALVERQDIPEAWVNLGAALRATGKVEEAAAALQKAIDLRGDLFEAWFNLGNARMELKQRNAAAEAFAVAGRLRPDVAEAWLNLGAAKLHEGAAVEAVEAFNRATAVKPELSAAWINAGAALLILGRDGQAVEYLRRGIELDPGNGEAYAHLAAALRKTGQYAAAAEALRRAVSLWPNNGDALVKLSALLQDLGLMSESLKWCEKYLAMNPADVDIASYRLCLLHLVPGYTQERIFQEHLDWDKRFGAKTRGPLPKRADHRRLRIGYVSPDFRLHSVSFFLEALLERHDTQSFEIYCYSDVARPDDVTARFRGRCRNWREIAGRGNDEVAEIIRGDEIDILVDLAGHTADNRLEVFSRRVAPVQVTYLGYPGSTGLKEMDFRLTDAWADPPGKTERYCTERLIRLPRTVACYRAWEKCPPPGRLRRAKPTFGCFTVLRKVGDEVLNAWGEILARVPGSKFFLGAIGLGDQAVRGRIIDALGKYGIGADRLIFQDVLPMDKYFAVHHEIDLYLDTFPVNGHTVVCHALWMGVPVINLAGEVYCQRLGASVLNNLGLGDWAVDSAQKYIDLAVQLAGDLPKMDLRERMKNSPVMHAEQFARDVEQAYREMWAATAR